MSHLLDLIRKSTPPIHKEGFIFIYIFAGITILLGLMSNTLGWIGTILTVWCVYFFRNPHRVTPEGDSLVVSPADGLVLKIEDALLPKELGLDDKGEYTRISIFLSVFDVHVNRVPATGEIVDLHYHPGKFLSADMDKASEDNERQTVLMRTTSGHDVAFVQIAGLIARRILCDLKEKQEVKAGERFGIIRFGSRMDVYLPKGIAPQVIEGQRAVGGETILADLSQSGSARKGEIR
jgi:phosphatidylserine decarboxylase